MTNVNLIFTLCYVQRAFLHVVFKVLYKKTVKSTGSKPGFQSWLRHFLLMWWVESDFIYMSVIYNSSILSSKVVMKIKLCAWST